jgi:AcrR family transcriptional regulator
MEKIVKMIREPKQKRSIKLKQKIIETALKIFSEKGYYHTSSTDISAAAGVSIGSFYSYFKDKKQLFIEVIKYFGKQIDSVINYKNLLPKSDEKEIMRKLLNNILLAHKINPKFQKEYHAMQILDPDINKIRKKKENEIIDSYYEGLLHWKNQINVKNLEATSFILFSTIESVIHDIVNNKTRIKEDIILEELEDMILRYLFHS